MSPKLKKERYSVIKYERLKELLKDENMTLSTLAEKICVDYPNLSRGLNKGEIQKSWLNSIADCLNVSVKFLSGETQIRTPRIYDECEKYSDREVLKIYGLSRYIKESDKLGLFTDRQLEELDYILLYMIEHPEKSVIENIRTEYVAYLRRLEESDRTGSWVNEPVQLFNGNSSK